MLPVVGETVRYTYRLRPGATAEAALLAEWGRCRWFSPRQSVTVLVPTT
ncbi:hypothetical protein [Plantactinospora sp. KLBMP9567]|nr:hypothetical protein [Plantactinospora sp. KLBMP9567]MDW5324174.1 hypothetical protein [Plantactinospora sp. KLBMP9567]